MRAVFTDGFNSLSHFALGVFGVYHWIILPLYVLYQYQDINEKNVRIDLSEFFIGYVLCLTLIQLKLIPG
jgi:hypothetical protein